MEKITLKKCFLIKVIFLCLLAFTAATSAEEPKNQVYLTSYHSQPRGGTEEWNNQNFGYAYRFDNNFKVGAYVNSLHLTTVYVGYEWAFNEYSGVMLAVGAGYDTPVGGSLYLKYKNIRTDVIPLVIKDMDNSYRYGVVFGMSVVF
jgi:hypothetical protein